LSAPFHRRDRAREHQAENHSFLLGSRSSLRIDAAFANEGQPNPPMVKDGQGFIIGLKLTRSPSVFGTLVASASWSCADRFEAVSSDFRTIYMEVCGEAANTHL